MSPAATAGPPRPPLPGDVTIERLPGLGTSWYDRGPGYWLRRVGLALLWALIVTLTTLIVVGVLSAIRHGSQAGFYVALVVEVAYSLAIVAFFAVRTARRWNQAPSGPPRSGRAARAGRAERSGQAGRAGTAGGALGVLARSGVALGRGVLVIGSVLFVGLYLALLLSSLLPQTLPERQARRRLADELRARGLDPPRA